ncbi:ARPP-2 domain-containing protein [Streptomyces fragilis]|uniref:ARG and Rhodanese-Phosphatase-superfamily-associated domain-containing protein n=1 Tax=Streptomyces fragilis TaxID=67301 RepID=A0ABV2YGQ5_9ACTN|nr:hypothetical protein [Streptomyces fragilis]
MSAPAPSALDLTGLRTLPAQVWGAVRLVPLVRDAPVEDLRLGARAYDAAAGFVRTGPRDGYFSYVPHGFVATWTKDGSPAAAYGTRLSADRDPAPAEWMPLRVHRRPARREARDRLRFLPLHLALEGYLALHFDGPSIAWEEWSQRAVRNGLSPRAEQAYAGAAVDGLAEALRVFEIHPGQCGVLLYAADALAAAFVVPHPDDYRSLHATLLQDLYGDLVYHYAMLMPPVREFRADLGGARIRSLADLRAAASRQEAEWAEFHDGTMAAGLLQETYAWRTVYRLGRFTLSRFLPAFRPHEENHIGEAITDERGRVAYLKTFRLSESQIRRGHLLDRLAAHDWHLADTAADFGITETALALRLENAGFGSLLRQDVLDHHRRRRREGQA